MKLWHITAVAQKETYDTVDEFVIAAPTAVEARRIASLSPGDEGAGYWLNTSKSLCKELKPGKTAKLIIRHFHAG